MKIKIELEVEPTEICELLSSRRNKQADDREGAFEQMQRRVSPSDDFMAQQLSRLKQKNAKRH